MTMGLTGPPRGRWRVDKLTEPKRHISDRSQELQNGIPLDVSEFDRYVKHLILRYRS